MNGCNTTGFLGYMRSELGSPADFMILGLILMKERDDEEGKNKPYPDGTIPFDP